MSKRALQCKFTRICSAVHRTHMTCRAEKGEGSVSMMRWSWAASRPGGRSCSRLFSGAMRFVAGASTVPQHYPQCLRCWVDGTSRGNSEPWNPAPCPRRQDALCHSSVKCRRLMLRGRLGGTVFAALQQCGINSAFSSQKHLHSFTVRFQWFWSATPSNLFSCLNLGFLFLLIFWENHK